MCLLEFHKFHSILLSGQSEPELAAFLHFYRETVRLVRQVDGRVQDRSLRLGLRWWARLHRFFYHHFQ